jgi:hypothetical protein
MSFYTNQKSLVVRLEGRGDLVWILRATTATKADEEFSMVVRP